MKNTKKKINLILFILSEILCFFILKTALISYESNQIHLFGFNIVQFLYFLPVFVSSLYLFLGKQQNRQKLIYTSLGLILYAIILHFFIRKIAGLFVTTTGMLNFVEYAAKIYFISLPLVAFEILTIKKETLKKSSFLLIFRLILLIIITILFKNLFQLKGILYSWPLVELISTFICFIKCKN